MRRILSIDGGGIRGILPASALIALEEQTGKPARESFDLIAGTSTGALIAAALAVGIPAKEILPVYTERAPREIFNGSICPEMDMLDRGFRYFTGPMARVVRSVFGAAGAAGWTLNDAPVRLFLTAVHVSKAPVYFVTDGPRNARTTGRVSLVDAAVASSAAPTYFQTWYVSPLPQGTVGPFGNELIGHCFDGGVGTSGNPVYEACVEAFCYDDFDATDTRVISLGTGHYAGPRQVNGPAGLLETITWTVNASLAAPHPKQLQQVERHWPGILRRVDWPLPGEIDMANMKAIPALVEAAQAARQMDWGAVLG